jgi:hypothetical protein
MSGELQILDALGHQFQSLGDPPTGRYRGPAEPNRGPAEPNRGVPRTLLLAAVLALLLAGVAAAAILISSGSPLPAPHAVDLQASGVPLPSTVQLAGLDAPDPDASAPPWDIRLSRTRAGETCTAVGQVLDGQFGIVGLDHVFRALPLGGVDTCGSDTPQGPVLAGARVFTASDPQEVRTVVNGVAGRSAHSVLAYGPDGVRKLHLGPQGSFITVYRGYVEEVRPRIVIENGDGQRHTIAFAQSTAFEVADPAGGSPWQASSEADLQPGAYPDENCAQATRETGPSNPEPQTSAQAPEVCGRLAQQPLFVSMRRFVPGGEARTGRGLSWPWGNNPARTIVYGAAAPRVVALTLSGAGIRRTLAIGPHGGVFLAVLDGHVDPRSLTLSARLRSGQTLSYTRSSNLLEYERNRPVTEASEPAYRNPLPTSTRTYPPLETPLRSTVRETLHAPDPDGGPVWALRSWQGRATRQASPGGTAQRMVCAQLGVLQDGALVEPRPGATALPIGLEQETGVGGARCNPPAALRHMTYMLQMQSYIGYPYAYSPRPLRTVLSGLLPPGATRPLLLGVGAPRALPVDPNNAFLVVLPGSYWDTSPHITYRLGSRLVGAGPSPHFPLGSAPSAPQARASDPDGGAPWGFAVAPTCATAIGRIVEGRLANIDEASATLTSGAGITGGGGCVGNPGARLLLTGKGPVEFDVQQTGSQVAPAGSSSAPTITRPQLERRTLPGRTIITGIATAAVASVTLATPRDVRTLRPTGPKHALIAVYDGQFFRGALTATIALRDGRTVTETLPPPPSERGDSPPLPPSLPKRIQLAEAFLLRLRSTAAGRRSRSVAGIEADLRVLRQRIAFERSHPGLLPAA